MFQLFLGNIHPVPEGFLPPMDPGGDHVDTVSLHQLLGQAGGAIDNDGDFGHGYSSPDTSQVVPARLLLFYHIR